MENEIKGKGTFFLRNHIIPLTGAKPSPVYIIAGGEGKKKNKWKSGHPDAVEGQLERYRESG